MWHWLQFSLITVTPYSSHNAPLHIAIYSPPHHTIPLHSCFTPHSITTILHTTHYSIQCTYSTYAPCFIHRTVAPHTLHWAQFIYTPTSMLTLPEASPSNCVHHTNICSSSHTVHCLHLNLWHAVCRIAIVLCCGRAPDGLTVKNYMYWYVLVYSVEPSI